MVAGPVDDFVTAALLARIAMTPLTVRRHGASALPASVIEAEESLAKVRAEKLIYARQAGDGHIGHEEYAIILEGLAERQKAAERALGTYAPAAQRVLREVPRAEGALLRHWEEASLERKREILKLFIRKVRINAATRGGSSSTTRESLYRSGGSRPRDGPHRRVAVMSLG